MTWYTIATRYGTVFDVAGKVYGFRYWTGKGTITLHSTSRTSRETQYQCGRERGFIKPQPLGRRQYKRQRKAQNISQPLLWHRDQRWHFVPLARMRVRTAVLLDRLECRIRPRRIGRRTLLISRRPGPLSGRTIVGLISSLETGFFGLPLLLLRAGLVLGRFCLTLGLLLGLPGGVLRVLEHDGFLCVPPVDERDIVHHQV